MWYNRRRITDSGAVNMPCCYESMGNANTRRVREGSALLTKMVTRFAFTNKISAGRTGKNVKGSHK